MHRNLWIVLPALLLWGSWTTPVRAEVIVRVPFFSLRIGPPACNGMPEVHVYVPGWVDVRVRGRRRVVAPPPIPVSRTSPVITPRDEPLPRRDVVQPPPPQPLPESVRVPTVAEFARTFKPAAGSYQVALLHPVTQSPVNVRFTLPDGSPRKVRVGRRELAFNYRRYRVRIRFAPDGRVKVIAR